MEEAVGPKAVTILVVNKSLPALKQIGASLKGPNTIVLQANSEAEAMKLVSSGPNSIDVLLADANLLGWSSMSLADTLRQARPALEVMLFCGDIVIGSFGCVIVQNSSIQAKISAKVDAILSSARTRTAGSAG